jgi:hypothetical protein
MKNPKYLLELALLDCLQANLNGLSEKHNKKLHKLAAKVTGKLAEKFIKLQSKEQKAAKEATATAAAARRKTSTRTSKRPPVLETSLGKTAPRSSRPKTAALTTKAA